MASKEAAKTACICENQKDCKDISSAFWILKDPRSGFLELRPSLEGEDIASDSEKFENACFCHLRPTKEEEQVTRQDSSPLYVALHHFSPEIILLCALTGGERSPSVLSTIGTLSTIPESTRKEVEANLSEKDRALMEEGKSVGIYHVFPNYGLNQARSDVKHGLKKVVRTEKKRRKSSEKKEIAPSKQSDENAPGSPTNVNNSSSSGPQTPLKEGGQQLHSPKHTRKDPDHSDASVDTCSSSTLDPSTPSPNKVKEASDVLKFMEEESLDVQKLKDNRIAGIVWEEYGSTSANTENEGEPEHKKTVPFDLDAYHLGKESCQAIDFMPSDLSLQFSESNDADSRLESTETPRSKKRFLESRSESMPILSVIESKRRVSMSLRLNAVKLEWSCYRDLIKDIIQETNRVDVLIQSSFQSLEGYVDSIHAISSDSFLDDRGNVIQRSRKKERIATQRSKVAQAVDDKESSMLNLLFHSFDQMAQSLDENIPALEEGAQEMADLKLGLHMRADALIASGERVLAEIEQYEANGQDAWDALVRSANTRYDAAQIRPTAPPSPSKAGSPSKIGTTPDDHWLSEASYKSAAVMILCGWESQCQELKLLYQKTLQLDEYRRDKTRQILLTFLPRQRRFFLRVTEALDVSFENLEVGRISRDAVDEEIEKEIVELSRTNLKREHPHHSSIMNRSRSEQPDLKVPSLSNNADVLQGGIFRSKLVQDMKVFEIRTRSWSPWKLALGVFTVGNYFHLFDVHDDSMEINLGNASVTEAISRVTSTKPDMSMVLSSCNCKHDSSKSYVEISIGTDSAFQKLFKRKISVRMSTFAETSIWMANLDRLRDEAAATLERQRAETVARLERQRVESAAKLERQQAESAASLERQRSFKKSKEDARKGALDRADSESAIQAFV